LIGFTTLPRLSAALLADDRSAMTSVVVFDTCGLQKRRAERRRGA
jgi:hypothetical protein